MKFLLLPLLAAAALSLTGSAPAHACGCGGCIDLQKQAPREVKFSGVLIWAVEARDARFQWDGYTGWQVVVDGVAYDVDLGRNAELHKLANSLNGGPILVEGTLRVDTHIVGRRAGPDGRRLMDARVITRNVLTVHRLGNARCAK